MHRAADKWRHSVAKFICAAVLILPGETFAAAKEMPQQHRYTSRSWQTDEGLPQNSVQALLQTSEGYILAATQQGVARFDGIRFTLFKDSSFPGLENLSVTALHQGSNGDLWIGLEDMGVIRWCKGKGSWFRKHNSLSSDVIRIIRGGQDGSVWIGTSGGLSRYKEGQFSHFTEEHGLSRNIVRALCEDNEGNLWIGTDNGLNLFSDGIIKTVPLDNGLERNSIRVIFADKKGTLWIGLHGGLTRMVRSASSSDQFEATHFTRGGSHSGNIVSAICEDSRGDLWVGTYKGLNRLVDGEFIEELNGERGSFDLVYSIQEDREGNIWVGTKAGLHCLTPRRFESLTTLQGLSHNNITSICEDKNGEIWIGTWGGGLNRLGPEIRSSKFNVQGSQPSTLNLTVYNSSNGLGSDFVLGLAPDQQGGLWVGTPFDTHNLKYFKDGTFVRYGAAEGFTDSSITVIQEDRSGNVWIGASGALNRFKDGHFQRYTTEDGLLHNRVRSIFETSNGELLLGTESGLTHYRNQQFVAGGTSLPVLSIYEDHEQTTWIATLGSGLTRSQPPHPLRGYTANEGMFDDNIYEILDDDRGFLWLSCGRGVFRVSKKDFDALDQRKIGSLIAHSYGKADGLPGIECSSVAKPSACKSRDGRLWFATTKGVAIVDPRLIQSNELPPPVVIEEVIADKQRFEVSGLKFEVPGARATSNLKLQTLNLLPGRGELEIHYTALSFRAPKKNQFKYKLEGIDADWIDAGTRRTAYYNNLSPGRYRFRVLACNNDGVWNETGASLGIVLQPHFWQTWWFQGVFGFVAVAIIGGTARYVTRRKLQRKVELLEQQHTIERERTRIARDMHDDLGSQLTEIQMLSDLALGGKNREEIKTQVARISDATREVIRGLGAIVWTVSPRNDQLDSMINFVADYAVKFLQRASIRCRLDIPEEIPSIPVSSDIRHNVFLVVKEALNNAAKYSGADEIRLRVRISHEAVIFSIHDNGKGFIAEDVHAAGNGLLNMRKRAENLGGQLEFLSAPGKGTHINLRIQLKVSSPASSKLH